METKKETCKKRIHFLNQQFSQSEKGKQFKGYKVFIPTLSLNTKFENERLSTVSCKGCKKKFLAKRRLDSQALIPVAQYYIHCISECYSFLKIGSFKACSLCEKIFLNNRSFAAHRRSCKIDSKKPRMDESYSSSFSSSSSSFKSDVLNQTDKSDPIDLTLENDGNDLNRYIDHYGVSLHQNIFFNNEALDEVFFQHFFSTLD